MAERAGTGGSTSLRGLRERMGERPGGPGGGPARAGGGLLAAPTTAGAARRAPENFSVRWPRPDRPVLPTAAREFPRTGCGARGVGWGGTGGGVSRRPVGSANCRRPVASGPTAAANGRTPRAGREGTNGRGRWGAAGTPGPRGRSRAPPAAGLRRTRRSPGCASARPDPARRGSPFQPGVFPRAAALALRSPPTVAVFASPKGVMSYQGPGRSEPWGHGGGGLLL